jgi:hypothetical protein
VVDRWSRFAFLRGFGKTTIEIKIELPKGDICIFKLQGHQRETCKTLEPTYTGPYRIPEKTSTILYQINYSINGSSDAKFHRRHLKEEAKKKQQENRRTSKKKYKMSEKAVYCIYLKE